MLTYSSPLSYYDTYTMAANYTTSVMMSAVL